MGTNHSAHTHVETYSTANPGTLLQGVIKILVDKATQAEQMSIQLTCTGKSRWRVRTKRGYQTNSAKRTLLKRQFPIWNFEGNLAEGQFELPFSIQLPTDLIPSFSFTQANNTYGTIEYSVKAVVGSKRDIKAHKSAIWINKYDNPSQVVSPVSAETTFRVSNCFCFKIGRASLKSTLNQNVVNAGTLLIVTSQIVNTNNKYTIKGIWSYLVRTIRLKATDLFIPVSSYIDTNITLSHDDLRIRPGQEDAQDIIHKLDLSKTHDISLMPPVASKVVDCEYSVKVELEFNNSCGCGNTSISIPLEICNGEIILNKKLSPPPNINLEWNPTMISNMIVHTAEFYNVAIKNAEKSNSQKQEAQVPEADAKKTTSQVPNGEEETKSVENQV